MEEFEFDKIEEGQPLRRQGVVINEPLRSAGQVAGIMGLSVAGLCGYASYFKYAYDVGREPELLNIRVWEDLYGRGLFFFLCSVAGYKLSKLGNDNISFFELEARLRNLFALRLFFTCASFMMLALAFTECKGTATPILVLSLSIPFIRLINDASAETKHVQLGILLVALAGLAPLTLIQKSLFKEHSHAVSAGLVYCLLACFFYTISFSIFLKLKGAYHSSIDTIYIALAMTLAMPSFVLGDYSVHPARFMIDRQELTYYATGGLLTWLFHSQLTRLFASPRHRIESEDQFAEHYQLMIREHIALYVLPLSFAVLAIVDKVWLHHPLSPLQITSAALIILPGLAFDLLQLKK